MILITGSSGFIGKRLHKTLINKLGANNVLALTSKPIENGNFLLHNNYNFSSDFFIENGYDNIDVIIHAGAYTPKQGSEANNIERSNSNINNTYKLIYSNLPNLKKIIFLSTLDVYGEDNIITEQTHESPVSLYGFSKLYCEKMLEAWGKQYDKKVQILRVGHVYGPGEEEYQKIIPTTISKIINDLPLQMWGSGEDLRAFIYIDDIVKSIINSIYLEQEVGAINLVSNQKISILDLMSKIITLMGSDKKIEHINLNNKVRNLVFDNAKMKQYLLENEVQLDTGLLQEIKYMEELLKK
ncbi:MAG: NAD(P)-dependent oxidoreductase [Bacteroidota bacterium]